jgi:hypothetical protein
VHTVQECWREWNRLVPIARERGVREVWMRSGAFPVRAYPRTWVVTEARANLRVDRLRAALNLPYGWEPVAEPVRIVESSVRACWEEWNRLVPLAQARGIPVQTRAITRTSRREANERLAWLRAQLGDVRPENNVRPVNAHPGTSIFDRPLPPRPEVVPFTGSYLSQTFGVEFEVIMPDDVTHARLAELLTAAGVETRSEFYGHATRSYWKVVTDGSLGDYSRGAEVVSPILTGEEGLEQVRKIARALKLSGCKVNERCGLHVHVGARGRPVEFFKGLMRVYQTFERTAIDSVVSFSRRESRNIYCRALNVSERALGLVSHIEDFASSPWNQASRYTKLNIFGHRGQANNAGAYWRHGTVEFRQHQGTVDADKASMWVRLCLRMTCACAANPGLAIASFPTTDLEAFLEVVRADDDERAYFRRRAIILLSSGARTARAA